MSGGELSPSAAPGGETRDLTAPYFLIFLRAYSLLAPWKWCETGAKVELKRPGEIGVVLHYRRGLRARWPLI